mmetsp:Transcript_93421/g.200453  ORF Transcript_93421/g.200453 Transcript_93421/m.200453 type:complete len:248 (-) Transcript_93421:1955-2698(-)
MPRFRAKASSHTASRSRKGASSTNLPDSRQAARYSGVTTMAPVQMAHIIFVVRRKVSAMRWVTAGDQSLTNDAPQRLKSRFCVGPSSTPVQAKQGAPRSGFGMALPPPTISPPGSRFTFQERAPAAFRGTSASGSVFAAALPTSASPHAAAHAAAVLTPSCAKCGAACADSPDVRRRFRSVAPASSATPLGARTAVAISSLGGSEDFSGGDLRKRRLFTGGAPPASGASPGGASTFGAFDASSRQAG